MERGEGSNQLPDLNKSIYEMDLMMSPPTSKSVQSKHEANTTNDDASNYNDSSVVAAAANDAFNNNNNNSSAIAGASPSDGPLKRGKGRPKGSKNLTKKLKAKEKLMKGPTKKKLKGKEKQMIPTNLFTRTPYTRHIITKKDQETGNVDLVNDLLMRFDAVRRRLFQSGEFRGEVKVALDIFKALNLHTNSEKRVGYVPGVALGDIFYQHGEMSIIGLHTATIGVEFIGAKDRIREDKLPLALSVVSPWENTDVSDDPQTLILSGLGGTEKYNDGQACDQTLKMTNLALETAMKQKSVVRVVRSKKDVSRTQGRIYIFDGLYMVTDMWDEKLENGYKVFKFKLERESYQKPAFEKWKWVEKWKNGLIARPGLILDDLSFGAENQKVSLVNEVDDEKAPAYFTYITTLKNTFSLLPTLVACCKRNSSRSCYVNCKCVGRNFDGRFPYHDGLLVSRKVLIFECGTSCLCSNGCKNRMINTGLKFKFEVFKTVECGWGLRSWDPIRAGSFICEYAGERIHKKGDHHGEEDEYLFDDSRVYKPFIWNYEPELVGEDANYGGNPDTWPSPNVFLSPSSSSSSSLSSPLLISGKKSGNVARFMNHSCSPNVFWQMISRERDGLLCLHIAFFAKKHIPPLTELTYDYGKSGGYGKMKCLCRSRKCSGSFG